MENENVVENKEQEQNQQQSEENSSAETKNTEMNEQASKNSSQEQRIPYSRFKEVNDALKQFKELGFDSPDQLKEVMEQLDAYKKADEERKKAEMSELERLQAELQAKEEAEKELSQQLEAHKKAVEQEKIRNAFITKAQAANIAYIDDAYALADLSSVKVTENGVEGIDEVVANLIENKPFLLERQSKTPRQIGEGTSHRNEVSEKTAEQLLKEAAEKARNSGKPEDKMAYAHLKRKLGYVPK